MAQAAHRLVGPRRTAHGGARRSRRAGGHRSRRMSPGAAPRATVAAMADWVILGCGYVGTRLTRALLEGGHRVRVCSRHVDRLADLAARGAHPHPLDGAKARAFGPALY